MKIGQRVKTPHGAGTIKVIENPNASLLRYGVKHDKDPEGYIMAMYKNKVMFYFKKELKVL